VPESESDIGSPVVYDGVVYFASSYNAWIGPGHLYALDARSGKQFWARTTPDQLHNPGTLSVFDGLVYVPTRRAPDSKDASALYVFDGKTGEERWTFRGGEYVTDATIAGGVLYIGTEQGDIGLVYALDAKTGRELRKIETSTAAISQPLIIDGVLYVRERGFIDRVVAIR
jgi:outer membrane protein assembly factor BamB